MTKRGRCGHLQIPCAIPPMSKDMPGDLAARRPMQVFPRPSRNTRGRRRGAGRADGPAAWKNKTGRIESSAEHVEQAYSGDPHPCQAKIAYALAFEGRN